MADMTVVPVLPKFVSHSIEATPCHNATLSYSSAFVRFVFESMIQRSVVSKKAPVCPLLQPFFGVGTMLNSNA